MPSNGFCLPSPKTRKYNSYPHSCAILPTSVVLIFFLIYYRQMFNLFGAFTGQILTLTLLLPVLFRPLFKKHTYADSVVMLSPLSMLLSVLLVFVYGLSWSLIVTALLSLSVLLTNVRALQRFAARLYVDYYSLTFRIAAFLESVFVIAALCALFVFHPLTGMLAEKKLYTGSFTRGFTEKRELFRPVNLITYSYGFENADSARSGKTEAHKAASDAALPLILFLPDIYTTAEDSALRLGAAAQQGFCVLSGDFYAPDVLQSGFSASFFNRRSTQAFVRHRLLYRQPPQTDVKSALIEQRKKELEALLVIAGTRFSSVVIVTEGEALVPARELSEKYAGFVRGVFDAASVPGTVYAKKTADLCLLGPPDAFFIFHNLYGTSLEAFFELQRAEKKNKSYKTFASALVSYVEEKR